MKEAGEGKDVSFRKLLLNRCQKEFEKENDQQALSEKTNQLGGLSVRTSSWVTCIHKLIALLKIQRSMVFKHMNILVEKFLEINSE